MQWSCGRSSVDQSSKKGTFWSISMASYQVKKDKNIHTVLLWGSCVVNLEKRIKDVVLREELLCCMKSDITMLESYRTLWCAVGVTDGFKSWGSQRKTEYMCVKRVNVTVRLQGTELWGNSLEQCDIEVKGCVAAGWNGWRKVSGVRVSAKMKEKVQWSQRKERVKVTEMKMLLFSLGATQR